ncbi:MAG TPA: bifunctional hydroxymethylpyrimidine kinase/phosphomethylpyrimidine kinase [Pyrinomonadaceae bacterium]|nr:bifunctional hydroxymethylpyrimidine kinase/phosphomethylpyrimidine kinase [Pyrinomonadaceae bacterium]
MNRTNNELTAEARPGALTIAGFDPSGGAGVLADSRTFVAFGCSASAVITSITYQNSRQVFGAVHQSAEAIRDQIMPLLEGSFACVKTGMLPTREIVNEVARLFRETDLPAPVVDPVIVSSSGQRLVEEEALERLIEELLPLARLVTPNIPEAERLTGIEIESEAGMREAAAAIRRMGPRAVLIKGGHLTGKDSVDESEEAIDVLDNDGGVTVFRHRRVPNVELHGTGCMLSAAIAAGLGKGMSLEDSVATAKQFVWDAIRQSA